MTGMVEMGMYEPPDQKRVGFENVQKLVGDLEVINQFLNEVMQAKKKRDNVIDFSDPDHKVLVEQVRDINPDLISSGVYSWDIDHLHLLTDKLKEHVSAIENADGDDELAKLTTEFDGLLKADREVERKNDDTHKFGYNIGALCVPLQQKRYDFGMEKIENQLAKIEKWTDEQKQINLLLSAVLSAKQGGATVIDLSDDNLKPLVDKVRESNPGLIPGEVYSWDLDHLPILTGALQDHVASIESSISLRMLYINHDMQELTELIREFYDMLKQDREGKTSIIRNTRG